jgi:hypothetical protein
MCVAGCVDGCNALLLFTMFSHVFF